jgi:hypothetical protein
VIGGGQSLHRVRCPTPHPATSRPTDRPPTNRPTDRPTYRPTDQQEYYELMYDFMYVCMTVCGWPHKVIYSNFLALVRIARQAYTWSIAAWIALNALGCCFGSSRVRNSAHEIKCYISNVQYSKYNIQFTTYKYHNLKCSIYFVCSPSRGEFVEILGSSSSLRVVVLGRQHYTYIWMLYIYIDIYIIYVILHILHVYMYR